MQRFLQVESPGPASSSSGRFSELLPPTQGGGSSSCRASGGGGQGGRRGGSSRKAPVPVPAGQSVCGHQPCLFVLEGRETGAGLGQEMKDKYQGGRVAWPSEQRAGRGSCLGSRRRGTQKTPQTFLREILRWGLQEHAGLWEAILIGKARTSSPHTRSPLLRTCGRFRGISSDPDCGRKAFQDPVPHSILRP